jgi:hypothetical protein
MNSSWKNCSIFNNFLIVGQNIMKPTWHTHTHQELSNGTKSVTKGTMVWEISTWQTNKTNKQPSFIDLDVFISLLDNLEQGLVVLEWHMLS